MARGSERLLWASVPISLVSDGNSIWVTNNFSNSVTRLNSSGAVVGTYKVGKGPFGIAYDGHSIWVTNYFGKSLTRLRAADGIDLGTVAVGDGAAGIIFDGANLWVVNNGDNTLMKITTLGAVLATYRLVNALSQSPLTAGESGCRTLRVIQSRQRRLAKRLTSAYEQMVGGVDS